MSYAYVPMPLNEQGDGPASEEETVRIEHQVWDMNDNSTVCVARDEPTARLIATLMTCYPDD